MKLSLKIAAATQIVSTSDMKTYLKIESEITEDDTLIANLIKSATKKIENDCGISLITQTWEVYFDSIGDKIEIPLPPLQIINHFYYYDDSYTQYTMDTDLYRVQTFLGAEPGYVKMLPNQAWPTYTTGGDAIKIEFDAGYGDDAADIPDDIINAIKMIVAHRYENRESQELPSDALDIIQNYKVYW